MADQLDHDLQLTKPLTHQPTALFLDVALTAEHLTHQTAELLKQHGLKPVQYNVLRILRGAGPEGLPCGAIGQRMITSDPDVTRIIDRLVKAGLAERTRDSNDRRVVRVIVTPAGLDVLAPLDPLVAELHEQQFANLTASQTTSLRRLLERLRQNQ